MILLDTSGVLAWIDGSQTYHRAVVEAMSAVEAPFILSPFVLAELDYAGYPGRRLRSASAPG